MSPSAEPTSAHAPTEAVELTGVLDDGEVVILAIKPSSWFVALVSAPVLGVAASIAAAAYAADKLLGVQDIPLRVLGAFCIGVMCLRIIAATFQWMGRLYVLTNLRVLRIRGIIHADVAHCPLKNLPVPLLSASGGERLLGLGSLYFQPPTARAQQLRWAHLAEPHEALRAVEEAIARAG